jgi:dephospho-CoA kinase
MNLYEYVKILEGVNDPSIFKAVFLAGGPGSGKSFVVGQTALTSFGFKVVNSDDAFEAALKKAGLEATPDNIFSPKGQEIRKKAKTLTKNKMAMYLKGKLGLVIDGTGKDYKKIFTQHQSLRKLGYETAMIFVNTDLETAMNRNKKRARTLPDDMVKKSWNDVQKNIGKFQGTFKNRMYVIDNSDDADYKAETMRGYKEIQKFSKKPPSDPKAKKWIKLMKTGGGKSDLVKLSPYQKMALARQESLAEVRQDSDIKDKDGTQPAKYYSGLSKSTKDKRDAHFKKKSSSPAPGDAAAETKPSKHTNKFKQMYGESKDSGLAAKAKKSGMPVSVLRQVYNRGMAAWKTGHRPGTTPQQWAMARVNSFTTKSSGTWGGADKDLAAKVKGKKESVSEDAPGNAVAQGGVDMAPDMGWRKGHKKLKKNQDKMLKVKETPVTDKRYSKNEGSPVLLKRFRSMYNNEG